MATMSELSSADERAILLIAEKLSAGDFDCVDVSDLFLRLRNYLPDKDPIKEVANFISHSERDRGATFDRTEAYIANVIDVMSKQFGAITWNPVLQWVELFDCLKVHLRTACAGKSKPTGDATWSKVKECVLRLLENRSLRLKNPRVTRCALVVQQEEVFIEFQLSGVRNIGAGMTWRVPCF